MAAATILTGIFPVAAHLGYWWCYAVRIVIGIVGVSSGFYFKTNLVY